MDAELVANSLGQGGLECEIVRVDTREEFVTLLEQLKFDLILADRTTPTFDGMAALGLARTMAPDVPFLFVTGTLDEELAISTLRNGATDYVLKDRLSRLIPAVRRALRDLERTRELDSAARALAEQAELLDLAHDMIIIRDLRKRVTYWNRGAERVYGWRREDVVGADLHRLLGTRFPQPVTDIEAELLQTGHWEGELQQTTASGTEVTVVSHWTLRRDASGAPTSILEINRDISERRNLEQQLLQAQKLESLGTLAGGIAHDFNNILGVILGYASILSDTSEPEEIEEITGTISQAGERGASLVRQLLTFARKDDAVLAPVAVNDVAEDLVKMLQQTFPKEIVFKKAFDARLPAVVADSSQLHQVLLNLCVNARDAMPSGGAITVSTSNVTGEVVRARFATALDPAYVCIRVRDEGIGMDAVTQRRIFEPFFTTKEVGKGTGLGLAVVYGVVQHHRGYIDIESAPGEGTAFIIFLPAADPLATADCNENGEPSTTQGGSETVLVVEDEDLLRMLVKNVLERQGYTVLTARDGLEGLELFRRHGDEIDLVLSDMGLPKIGGLQMFLRMKETGRTPKAIFCSGYLEPDSKTRLMEAGVTDFLMKPFRPAQILGKVREILDSRDEAVLVA